MYYYLLLIINNPYSTKKGTSMTMTKATKAIKTNPTTLLILQSQSLSIRKLPAHTNKPLHYALTFLNIPYYDKNHQLHYSELIFHDCTFIPDSIDLNNNPCIKKINKTTYLIPNFQPFIYNNIFTFQYHETPSTTTLYTITTDHT